MMNYKHNILINAISIKEGGSLVVVNHFIKEFSALRPDFKWYVVVSRENILSAEDLPENLEICVYPWVEHSALHLWYWYEIYLSKLIKKKHLSMIFSLTNYLPRKKLSIPSLLLVQHAGHFSALFNQLMTKRLGFLGKILWNYKKRWVYRSVQQATLLTVQTQALKKEIHHLLGSKIDITVIPHGAGLSPKQKVATQLAQKEIALGYVSKYGIQKNFSVLIEAVKQLREKGFPVTLILTLGKQVEENQKIFAEIEENNLTKYVLNLGELEQNKIGEVYQKIDIFIFPSLVESFGMPMVEAMSAGLPIIAANTPVNKEVLGEEALLFAANDVKDLVNKIITLIKEPESYQKAVNYSIQRGKNYSWKNSAKESLTLMESLLN